MILADSHESLRAALDAARQRDDEGYRRMMTWALDTLAMQCERLILLGDPEHLVYSPRYLAAVEKARTIARLGEASSDTR
jgi:hypothetical protein